MSSPEADSEQTGPTANTEGESDRPEPASEWQADRPKEGDSLGTLWVRWTDGRTDLQFHCACEILPRLRRKPGSLWPEFEPEEGDYPTFRPVNRDDTAEETDTGQQDTEPESDETIQFQFLHGLPRQLLRHVPFLILVATVVVFGGAELSSTVGGLSDLAPTVTSTNVILFGVFLAIIPLLVWLLTEVGVVKSTGFLDAAGIYGLMVFLGVGTAISILFVLGAEHPSEIEPNVVLVSGYLLTLLVGGMLLYEAVLRIEHLFVKLHRRSGDIITNPTAYRAFLTDLHRDLNDATVAGLSPSRLFGLLFALQFFIIWTLGSGPQGMEYTLGLGVNFVLNVVLVTIVFQFFVLVRYFHQLMNERKEYSEVGLKYEPFHIDGHGGFRDFGRFATRINAILTIAGLYLVYRLYVIGGRRFPVEGFAGFSTPLDATVWLVSYAGPVIAYLAGILAWGYYSFWSLHRKMEQDKKLLTRKYQGQQGPPDANRTPSAGDRIDSFEEAEGPEWASLQAAPTWPLDVNKLVSLISGNFLPLLVPVADLFL